MQKKNNIYLVSPFSLGINSAPCAKRTHVCGVSRGETKTNIEAFVIRYKFEFISKVGKVKFSQQDGEVVVGLRACISLQYDASFEVASLLATITGIPVTLISGGIEGSHNFTLTMIIILIRIFISY